MRAEPPRSEHPAQVCPHNLLLLKKIPSIYRSPKDPRSTSASIFVLTGTGTVFDGKEGIRIRDIIDGTSDTLLVVEAKRNIPWTKPEDIPYDPDKPLPNLGGYEEGGFNAALCDGASRFFSEKIDEWILRAAITRNDGQPLPRSLYEPAGSDE